MTFPRSDRESVAALRTEFRSLESHSDASTIFPLGIKPPHLHVYIFMYFNVYSYTRTSTVIAFSTFMIIRIVLSEIS